MTWEVSGWLLSMAVLYSQMNLLQFEWPKNILNFLQFNLPVDQVFLLLLKRSLFSMTSWEECEEDAFSFKNWRHGTNLVHKSYLLM